MSSNPLATLRRMREDYRRHYLTQQQYQHALRQYSSQRHSFAHNISQRNSNITRYVSELLPSYVAIPIGKRQLCNFSYDDFRTAKEFLEHWLAINADAEKAYRCLGILILTCTLDRIHLMTEVYARSTNRSHTSMIFALATLAKYMFEELQRHYHDTGRTILARESKKLKEIGDTLALFSGLSQNNMSMNFGSQTTRITSENERIHFTQFIELLRNSQLKLLMKIFPSSRKNTHRLDSHCWPYISTYVKKLLEEITRSRRWIRPSQGLKNYLNVERYAS